MQGNSYSVALLGLLMHKEDSGPEVESSSENGHIQLHSAGALPYFTLPLG